MMMKREKNQSRKKQALQAGWIGIVTNFLLFSIKLFAGWMSQSLSIMADAMNSLFDSLSALLVILGFKWAAKPADKDHPYGHQRAEYITSLAISLVIISVGFQFLLEAITKISSPQTTYSNGWIIVIMLLSIFIKILQAIYYRFTAKKLNLLLFKL